MTESFVAKIPVVPAGPVDRTLSAAPAGGQSARSSTLLLAFGLCAAVWIAYFPLPVLEFYKEWVYALTLGMAALLWPVTAPLRRGRWPAAETVLVGVLGGLLLVQAGSGQGLWPKAIMTAGFLVVFLLAHLMGRHAALWAPDRLPAVLGGVVVTACLGNCAFSAAQISGWSLDWPLVAGRTGARVAGNLAQANHAATLLWMGVVAAAGLRVAGVVGLWVMAALVGLFAGFTFATGSRMPILMDLAVLAGGGAVWWRARTAPVRQASALLMGCALALPFLELGWNLSGLPDLLGLGSPVRRFFDAEGQVSSGARRWLLFAAWDAISTHPWAGVGVGRFAHHTYVLATETGRQVANSAEMHAHNLIVHLGAELGAPAALAAGVAVVAVLRRAWRCACRSVPGLVMAAMVLVLLIHAGLEYPLWYAYFLGALGMLTGALFQLDGGAPAAAPHAAPAGPVASLPRVLTRQRLVLRGLGSAVIVLSLAAYRLFAPLEHALQEIVFQVSLGAVLQPNDRLRAELAKVPAWSPYADYARAAALMTTVPSPDNAADMTRDCERTLLFGPSAYVLARCAVAFQLAGMPERASALATSQCTFYPGRQSLIYEVLTLLAPTQPQVLALKAPCLQVTIAPRPL